MPWSSGLDMVLVCYPNIAPLKYNYFSYAKIGSYGFFTLRIFGKKKSILPLSKICFQLNPSMKNRPKTHPLNFDSSNIFYFFHPNIIKTKVRLNSHIIPQSHYHFYS